MNRRSLLMGAGAALIARPALAAVPRLRNPLAYPGGTARFSSAHPAAGKVNFSAVALSSGTAVNLTSGAPGAVTNGPFTVAIDGLVGTYLFGPSSATESTFTGAVPSATDTQNTMAVICIAPPTSSYNQPLAIGTGSSGPGLAFNSGTAFYNMWGGSNPTASVAAPAGTRCFLAVSMNGSKCNVVLTNMANGQVLSSTSASTTQVAHNGNIFWDDGNGSGAGGMSIATAMYSTAYMSLPQLLSWAKAPWDYWYPTTSRDLLISSLGKQASAPPASNGRTLMGVGQ